MGKTDEKIQEYSPFKIGGIFSVIGILFLVIVYGVVTNAECSQVKKNAETTLQFVRSLCRKYDDYRLGNLTRDLQIVINKSRTLSSYVKETQASLEEYTDMQDLTGSCILDADAKVVLRSGQRPLEEKALLKAIRKESNLKSIIQDSRKTYADQIELEGRYYNYALVARTKKPGVILCYDDITRTIADKNELSLGSLLAGDTFEGDAQIIVTDGKTVVGTNVSDLQGLAVDQCPVISAYGQDKVQNDRKLFELRDSGKSWYGKQEFYRSYYLYVVYSDKNVFANRIYYMLIACAGYMVVCVLLANLLEHTRKLRLKHMEKEYHLVSTIASIYEANLLIRLKEDSWEAVVKSERFSEVIDGTPSAREMLKVFTDRLVQDTYQEGFTSFAELDTLDERLRGKTFIGYSYESKQGHWYLSLFIPQRDAGGRLQSVMLVFRNVTDQKRKEMEYQKQLRVTAEEAKRADDAKTDFLRRMSHDIRTPINGIRGMVEIGKSCEKDVQKTDECYDKILGASDFLLDLVNNVLDMSKLEAGEIEMEHKPFDLKELMKDSLLVVESQAAQHGITIHRDAAEGNYWHFVGNPLHLKQVFQNIVSNAIKYNKENGSVRVWCRQMSVDAGYATFEFGCEDTGIGMSQEFQKHAFDTFAQESDAVRTTYSGSGLGLPIAKKLVEHMGGTISFVSEQGKGTTFTVHLPLQIDQKYCSGDGESKTGDVSIQDLRVLLVEDNELNMEIAEYMLTDKGAVVTKAYNGREALEKFEASDPGSFDVILMDIMMPEMDGLETTKAIRGLSREDAGSVPIIAMSANAFADDITRSKAAGMNAHLSKPLDFEELFRTIKRYGGAGAS